MKKIRIIADDKIPFLQGVFDDVATVSMYPGKDINAGLVREADALITRTRTRCNRDLLEGSTVRFIASATIGYDHIDTEYCREKGIRWTNAPGCNASSVEQYIVSVLLNLAVSRDIRLGDMTIGVIGVGNVGSKVARVAKVLGMKVLMNDPPRARTEGDEGFVNLETIMEQADVITFHVPLNREGQDKTLHLASEKFFGRLSKKPFLINSSRGEVVDGEALLRALRTGKLAAACLDVWENEPDISGELLDLLDIATPHIAGYSTDGKANGTMMSVRAVSRFFGLGLEDWTPRSVPAPDNLSIVVDCTGMDETEILSEVYLSTYDVRSDDERLRKDRGSFEYLRGHYPVRREPAAYTVKLINNAFDHLPHLLEELGFTVLEISCFC